MSTFRKAYADSLKIAPNEVTIGSVTCNNQRAPAPAAAPQPKPAHKKRLLLAANNLDAAAATSTAARAGQQQQRQLMQAEAAPSPAAVSTEFQVPAPADPKERQALAEQIKKTSQGTLTGPLSVFFGKAVQVSPPVQLQEPTKKQPAAQQPPAPVPAPLPRSAAVAPEAVEEEPAVAPVPVEVVPPPPPPPAPRPRPAPQPIRPPAAASKPVEEEEVAEEVPVLPVHKTVTTTGQKPGANIPEAPAKKPGKQAAEQTPTTSLQLPKGLPKPSPLPPPPSPQPKVIMWGAAPACKGKPNGDNSVPGGLMTVVLNLEKILTWHFVYALRPTTAHSVLPRKSRSGLPRRFVGASVDARTR